MLVCLEWDTFLPVYGLHCEGRFTKRINENRSIQHQFLYILFFGDLWLLIWAFEEKEQRIETPNIKQIYTKFVNSQVKKYIKL